MKRILKLLRSSALLLFMVLSFVALGDKSAFAQYGSGSYGGSGSGTNNQCTYGQACPIELQPTDPVPDPDPTIDQPAELEEPVITPDIIEQDDGDSGGDTTTTTNSPPKASDKVKVRGIQGIVLKQTVDLVERIPEAHRVTAPYYSWLVLLLLSLIMIVIAIADRYKSVRLINSVKELQQVLQEQKNFLRLALHNLNTPLATTKGAVDLLSTKSSEKNIINELQSATVELESTINKTTSSISSESISDSTHTKSNVNVTFFKIFGQWYFFVPVVASILFAILINSAISYTDTDRPNNYLFVQVAVAVMITLIFANSIRLLRISKNQKRIYRQVKTLVDELRLQRSILINNLKDSLSSIILTIESSISLIKDKKMSAIMSASIGSLKDLVSKIDMATRSDISNPINISIVSYMNQLIDSFAPEIKSKGIDIKSNYNGLDNIVINFEEADIAIRSVFDNAIEYNKDGGSINIEVSKSSNNNIGIKFTDSGEGIEKEALSTMFQPFSKTNDVLTYDHSGMGMSLYASKAALNRIGGDINIQSKIDKGTTTVISIPTRGKV